MDLSRFWTRVIIRQPDDCWEWMEGKTWAGYGAVNTKQGQYKAHRLAWELSHGPIPDGIFVLHTCDNPACCNPHHLFLGTQTDNMADMNQKGRHGKTGHKPGEQKGERNYNAKLNQKSVNQIKKLLQIGSYTHEQIAKKFDVSRATISMIHIEKNWKGEK